MAAKKTAAKRAAMETVVAVPREPISADNEALFKSVDDFGFTVRTANYLQWLGITVVGQLVVIDEATLAKYKGIAVKSVVEIKEALLGVNLQLGTPITGWDDALKARGVKIETDYSEGGTVAPPRNL